MAKKPGPNKHNLEVTKTRFLKKARKEFSSAGYANSSTNRIVVGSGMARGSLYYHFGDKKGLFAAVYEQILLEIEKAVLEEMAKETHPWETLKAGCAQYIREFLKKDVRRIVLESYVAFDYRERLQIQRKTLLGTLEGYIERLTQAGYFKGQDPFIVSLLIYGMVSEAGRSLELADDPKTFLPPLIATTMDMMDRIRE